MRISSMSIENMISVSHLLFALAGLFAVTALVLFFTLDIAKCWRMVSGRHPVPREKRQKTDRTAMEHKAKTEKLEQFPTEKIKTVFLDSNTDEGTELLDPVSMELIQDIVYVQNTGKIE